MITDAAPTRIEPETFVPGTLRGEGGRLILRFIYRQVRSGRRQNMLKMILTWQK